ncbi:MAG: C39 family peptidase [Eubacterium sp.]|nr:C39 family peptidase [Eubacterium sp.]
MEQKEEKYRRHILLVCGGCAVILAILLLMLQVKPQIRGKETSATASAVASSCAVDTSTPAAVSGTAVSVSAVAAEKKIQRIKKVVPTPTPKPTPIPTPSVTKDKTDRIASFFQGDFSYQSKLTWSGNWGKKKFKKKTFGSFGCGLCCLANVYSSLTPYRCSPMDMYEYAKEETAYKGAGAIEWWNMGTVLTKTGFTYVRGKKPKKYEDFQKMVQKSKAVIVLVSQGKKSYWEGTTGHYVTLFLYDKKTDQVFLADSGSYKRNRHWVPLKKVYNSLKKTKDSQYLSVLSYKKKQDTWRNVEFTGKCILPSNWKMPE